MALNVHLFTFLPNTTHLSQPNDLQFNSAFKKNFQLTVSIEEEANQILGVTMNMQEALHASMTTLHAPSKMSTIQSPFAASGVYPPQADPTRVWRLAGVFSYCEHNEERIQETDAEQVLSRSIPNNIRFLKPLINISAIGSIILSSPAECGSPIHRGMPHSLWHRRRLTRSFGFAWT